ncbi:MAG: enoyl-CoA hydratase [Chlorobi bacterium]|nr:enoyl-CoA hydratase [Chlorobiota bacterium]
MKFNNLIVKDLSEHLRLITINRPRQLNALNRELIRELHDALEEAEKDPGIRAVILMGSGDKAFIAGADIKEFMHFTPEEGEQLSREGQQLLFDYVEQMGTPVIAAINGYALGGGLELALAAHIRIASEKARMGLPEVSLGVIPGYGGTQRLAQHIGKGRAMEMILTGKMIDARRAYDYGLVSEVTPHEKLLDVAVETAEAIMKNSPSAIALAIRAINSAYGRDGFKVESRLFGQAFATEDFKEGTTAFVEKRKPRFTGK